MAEVLMTFAEPAISATGGAYSARACGRVVGHTWEGWIEFVPLDGGTAVRSGRETTQPNRSDLVYWASGLTPVFLEGSLARALNPVARPVASPARPPAYDGPAPSFAERDRGEPVAGSVLNPVSLYRKGEGLLRKQLAALSVWHLVNIVRDYELSSLRADELNRMGETALVELIVAGARDRAASPANR